jgi:hypothetical protein
MSRLQSPNWEAVGMFAYDLLEVPDRILLSVFKEVEWLWIDLPWSSVPRSPSFQLARANAANIAISATHPKYPGRNWSFEYQACLSDSCFTGGWSWDSWLKIPQAVLGFIPNIINSIPLFYFLLSFAVLKIGSRSSETWAENRSKGSPQVPFTTSFINFTRIHYEIRQEILVPISRQAFWTALTFQTKMSSQTYNPRASSGWSLICPEPRILCISSFT